MDVLLRLSEAPSAWNPPSTSVISSKMKNYAQFGFNAQSQSDPNGIDVEGEPKYYAAPNANAGKVSLVVFLVDSISLFVIVDDLSPMYFAIPLHTGLQ